MKRRRFLQTTLAATPLVAPPSFSITPERDNKGFKVKAGEGRIHGHIQNKINPANTVDVKVSGKDTDGDLFIFEQTGLSAKIAVPLHIHHFQDEIFQVTEGEYYVQVGEEKYRLTQGDNIFLPRKVPHAWTQVSDKAKMAVILQPAGKLEEFFITMSKLKTAPTSEEITSIFEAHEMEIVGPRLEID